MYMSACISLKQQLWCYRRWYCICHTPLYQNGSSMEKKRWKPPFGTFNFKSVFHPIKCIKSSPVHHFSLRNASHCASQVHCKCCVMLSVSCNWFHFHREVLRHSHTHLYMYTPALQSAVDVLPEEPCLLKYRPARADVQPVWVAARWSVSDLSVWLPNPIPPPPESPVRP